MVNYFIYAKDVSGTTDGNEYYHENGLKTLEQFKKDVEEIKTELLEAGEPTTESKVVYLHWGTECYEVDEDKIRTTYLQMQSDWACTRPESIINCLKTAYNLDKNNNIKLLYIITDGIIETVCTERCFELNENMNYETVVFHAFQEELELIDLSVASSFFKSRCVVYCNNELYDYTDISKEFDYDHINLENFEAEKDQLKSYIRFKFIHKSGQTAVALEEIEKLKKLRARLFYELPSNSAKSKGNLETKDRNVFLYKFVTTDRCRNLTATTSVTKVDIEQSISTLINYIVSDAKSYSFDALKFDKNLTNPLPKKRSLMLFWKSTKKLVSRRHSGR